MNKESNNIYKKARIRAGFKREPVAEELNIDVRTLDKYESLDGHPPDDIVRKMCLLYGNKLLAWEHIKQSPLAEFFPSFEESTLQGATLQIVSTIYTVNGIVQEMAEITADGKIDENERPVWLKDKKHLTDLCSALLAILFANEEGS